MFFVLWFLLRHKTVLNSRQLTRDHLRNAMPMVVHFSGFAFCSNDEEDAYELPLGFTRRWRKFVNSRRGKIYSKQIKIGSFDYLMEFHHLGKLKATFVAPLVATRVVWFSYLVLWSPTHHFLMKPFPWSVIALCWWILFHALGWAQSFA